jgi:septal ring factor EnvC (AmiA/AmiB activator)|tara:strand:+ start:62 stop:385 length:324 start_codon:yes stop_codon:yes gene_type:complete
MKVKEIFLWLVGIVGALFGMSAVLGRKNSTKVKELKKAIKNNVKQEKQVTQELKKLETNKTRNKKEITQLKRKLTKTKKDITKMKKDFDNVDVEDATDFLRNFSKNK